MPKKGTKTRTVSWLSNKIRFFPINLRRSPKKLQILIWLFLFIWLLASSQHKYENTLSRPLRKTENFLESYRPCVWAAGRGRLLWCRPLVPPVQRHRSQNLPILNFHTKRGRKEKGCKVQDPPCKILNVTNGFYKLKRDKQKLKN